jgi:hypothetical protein
VLANGGTSTTILPDAFPVRDFPISKTTELGLYAQDEMRWPTASCRWCRACAWTATS